MTPTVCVITLLTAYVPPVGLASLNAPTADAVDVFIFSSVPYVVGFLIIPTLEKLFPVI